MTIPVVHDQEPAWMPAEKCAFCRVPTRTWYTARDVPVCPSCATTHEPQNVPSKRDWLIANGAKLSELWTCHADREAAGAST